MRERHDDVEQPTGERLDVLLGDDSSRVLSKSALHHPDHLLFVQQAQRLSVVSHNPGVRAHLLHQAAPRDPTSGHVP